MTEPSRSEGGLIVEVRDRVAYATLDRPERLYALSVGLTNDLVDAFDSFSTDPGIWAVLLTSTGERGFLRRGGPEGHGSGRRIPVRRGDGSPAGAVPMTGAGRRNFFEVIMECAKPTVAAVFGWAMGGLRAGPGLRRPHRGGRPAHRHARDETGPRRQLRVGGAPRCGAPRPRLPDAVYRRAAVGRRAALRWGLVQSVVPRAELAGRAEALVRRSWRTPRSPTQRYKAMISKGRDLPVAAALRLNAGPNPYLSEDRKEGVAAFLERRTPHWQAR